MASQRSRVLLGAVVAVLVAVGIVVAVVLLSRGSDDVTLPDEVAGITARDTDAFVPDSAEDADELIARQREARDYAAAKYSDAFDDADADVRSYADPDDLDSPQYSVVAVEAEAGPVLPDFPFDDPSLTRLSAPQVDRVEEGDAECLVRRTAAPQGADAEADEPVAVVCQRTSSSLTVRVSASGDPSVEATVDFLDAVWEELG